MKLKPREITASVFQNSHRDLKKHATQLQPPVCHIL